jgi:hypothetical protein
MPRKNGAYAPFFLSWPFEPAAGGVSYGGRVPRLRDRPLQLFARVDFQFTPAAALGVGFAGEMDAD